MEHLEKRWGSEGVIWRVKRGEGEFVGGWVGVRLRVKGGYITGDFSENGYKILGFWGVFGHFSEGFGDSEIVSLWMIITYKIGQNSHIWQPSAGWWLSREFWALFCKEYCYSSDLGSKTSIQR